MGDKIKGAAFGAGRWFLFEPNPEIGAGRSPAIRGGPELTQSLFENSELAAGYRQNQQARRLRYD